MNCARRRLRELARLDDAAFRALFSKSPVKRIGRDRFIRNVLIAIGNADDASLAAEAERLLDDASPLVRGAAVWALAQLVERERFEALAAKAMGARRMKMFARSGGKPPSSCPAKAGHPVRRGISDKPICPRRTGSSAFADDDRRESKSAMVVAP